MSLILLVALILVIVLYRRWSPPGVDIGAMARRLLEYGFLAGLVLAVSLGATGLLARLFEGLRGGRAGDPEELALWLSLVVVAGGALAGLAAWLRRRFRADPTEVKAAAWIFYIGVVDLTAVGFVVVGVTQIVGWVLDGWSFDSWMTAAALVWTLIATIHHRLPGRRPPIFNLVGSAVSLAGVGISLAVVLEHLLDWAYDGVTPTPLSGIGLGGGDEWAQTIDGIAGAASPLVAFAGAWLRYWWWNARRAPRSQERDGYVLVCGVLGGLAATLVAAGGLIHTALSWLLVETARDVGAAAHFDVLSVFGALLLLGLGLWAYHRREVPHAVERQVGGRDEVVRLYDHLEAGAGLSAVTLGIGLLLGTVLHRFWPAPEDWNRDIGEVLAAALTALLIGVPVWARAWRRIQGHAGTVAEESSAVRRVYLFVVFGVTALCGLVSVGAMVYLLLFGLLDGSLDVERVAIFRVPLAAIGATVGVAAYHGRVLQVGLRTVPQSIRPVQRTVTLIGGDLADLEERLEKIAGVRVVSRLRLEAPDAVPADLDSVVMAVEATCEDLVVVVADDGSADVIPVAP